MFKITMPKSTVMKTAITLAFSLVLYLALKHIMYAYVVTDAQV